ncbi:MAG: hypothetical protein L3J29_01810 [Cyclobacteriaceae bacterium]|nr:hypothetical protein [Cyclobacteriaceae bacterium]
MQKSIFVLFSLALLSFTSDDLVKVKLNDEVTVYVPKSFSPMTKEDMGIRYQSYRVPLALYTDASRLVDFGVNRSFTQWQEKDLAMMGEFYEASLMELYDKVTFIEKGIKEVNGHQFVFFEFISLVYPDNDYQDSVRKYTYLMYGLTEGTSYIFNFSCDKPLQEKWQATARQMMSQIKLKN